MSVVVRSETICNRVYFCRVEEFPDSNRIIIAKAESNWHVTNDANKILADITKCRKAEQRFLTILQCLIHWE